MVFWSHDFSAKLSILPTTNGIRGKYWFSVEKKMFVFADFHFLGLFMNE
jgi:hypothetical protein